jgi:hypothetical protein
MRSWEVSVVCKNREALTQAGGHKPNFFSTPALLHTIVIPNQYVSSQYVPTLVECVI